MLAVATIGMEVPTLSHTENALSFSVCVLLLGSSAIEVPTLTSFIETQAITATGVEGSVEYYYNVMIANEIV